MRTSGLAILAVPALLAATGCGAVASALSPGPDIEEVADLGALCSDIGDGWEDAAPYEGEGLHTTAIFEDSEGADVQRGAPGFAPVAQHPDGDSEDSPIHGWRSEALEDQALLLCLTGHGPQDELRECSFSERGGGGETTLPFHSQKFTLTLYELSTGDVLHEGELVGANGRGTDASDDFECPSFLQYEEMPTELYASLNAQQLREELDHIVESPA
ncbi:hypothetical protein [Nocardiopsis coralliicola]